MKRLAEAAAFLARQAVVIDVKTSPERFAFVRGIANNV